MLLVAMPGAPSSVLALAKDPSFSFLPTAVMVFPNLVPFQSAAKSLQSGLTKKKDGKTKKSSSKEEPERVK